MPNKESIFNIPNLLTSSRIIFSPLLAYSIFKLSNIFSASLFILVSLTDLFDGIAARKLKQKTKFGKFLDAFADKILILTVISSILIKYEFYLILFIFSKEAISIVLLAALLKKNRLMRYTPTFIGKTTTFFQYAAIAAVLFELNYYFNLALIIATFILGLMAGFIYLKEGIKAFENEI